MSHLFSSSHLPKHECLCCPWACELQLACGLYESCASKCDRRQWRLARSDEKEEMEVLPNAGKLLQLRSRQGCLGCQAHLLHNLLTTWWEDPQPGSTLFYCLRTTLQLSLNWVIHHSIIIWYGNDDSVAKSGFRKAMLDLRISNYTWVHEHEVDLTNSGFLHLYDLCLSTNSFLWS